ncbi:MAG: methyltransferase domain-containing protein [Rhodospirillales bacterium]|nr:methyltransferase domain-containing protein [Rhodospirillales bacterium]
MNSEEFREFPCDLCGHDDAHEIDVLRRYTGDQPIHVCRNCGFVYVRRRRSPEAIARSWSEDIFQKGYTARIPAVRARHAYVAEFINGSIGLAGKRLCDIGSGEGLFVDLVRKPEYGARVFAIEPSSANCRALADLGVDAFQGIVEDYMAAGEPERGDFDIVTILWTLENCQSCRAMIEAAYDALAVGGHLVVATGSRLLVPFKKPLHDYLGDQAADAHCFRFSANTLAGLLAVSGFVVTHVNRYLDSDPLVMISHKTDRTNSISWDRDDWRAVLDFFHRWDVETRAFYPEDEIGA